MSADRDEMDVNEIQSRFTARTAEVVPFPNSPDEYGEPVSEPQARQGGRLPLISFKSMETSPVSDYLVKHLIPRIGIALAWGPPKCGKSFWVFDLAMHVARGLTYRGRKTRQGTVVYCAFEGGHGFMKRGAAKALGGPVMVVE